ncbi:MAG: hypothetical protein JSV09_16155 [Thermoplasmata archaeon]|nr:MAG: hypothetical protein JSV09_16155 [Thermoplasmata archaeon]
MPEKEGRDVKIREGIMILNRTFTHDDWEVEMNLELEDGKIKDLKVMESLNFEFQKKILKTSMFDKMFTEKEVLNTLKELHET